MKKHKRLEIIKDGSIQGWFVSFIITMVTLFGFVGSMVSDAVSDRFSKVGGAWAAIVIGQFTAWLAYKGFTAKTESLERKDIRGQDPCEERR